MLFLEMEIVLFMHITAVYAYTSVLGLGGLYGLHEPCTFEANLVLVQKNGDQTARIRIWGLKTRGLPILY